jgi:hypothetical protein
VGRVAPYDFCSIYGLSTAKNSSNEPRQPTPGGRLSVFREHQARRGCAQRWASRMKLAVISLALILAATACKHPKQARHQPPTATEIQQKIVGTWFLDRRSADGKPETITVVFGADGSFESSRNFTDLFEPPQAGTGSLAYRATWHAEDGYFTVTKSNSLPRCNLQMFTVDRLDEHEMVCGHPSAEGERFRR